VTVAVADARRRQAAARSAAGHVAETNGPATKRTPGLDDVERVLKRTGTSSDLILDVLTAVEKSGARGAFALDVAAKHLGSRLRVAPSPKIPGAAKTTTRQALAFVGPTGVGKTTTIAKLATRLVRAGRRIGLITLDTHRPGAAQQLAEYGKLLQVPVDAVQDGSELVELMERSRQLDVVLVDTTGRSPHDAGVLSGLARDLAGVSTYLTVSATTAEHSLDEVASGFAALRPSAVVITKLDETRRPAPALEHALRADLPVAFLCDGANVSAHLHRPRPDHFADLFLRGRLA
jgi:flagellar biosynthesis protein FlhF